ncbi:MAG: hypothetical protein AB1498_06285 [bacterium]
MLRAGSQILKINTPGKYLKLVLLVLIILTGKAQAEEKYVYKDIVTVKWGSKTGEIGKGFDDLQSLPYLIKANANNQKIYLYDNINSKIESFDYNGNHLCSFPTDIEQGNTIFFDGENNAILIKSDFVGPKIDMRRYGSKGELLNKFDLTPENLNTVEYGHFFIINQTLLIFPNLDNNKKFWSLNMGTGKITYDVEATCITSIKGLKKIFIKREELTDKENNKYKYYIEIKDENDKVLNRFSIADDLGPYCLSGVDKNNFVYLVHESNETQVDPNSFEIIGHEVRLAIAKYSEEGRLILKQELAEDYDADGLENKRHSFIDVDINGSIFQILGKKDGVHILKWEQKTGSP